MALKNLPSTSNTKSSERLVLVLMAQFAAPLMCRQTKVYITFIKAMIMLLTHVFPVVAIKKCRHVFDKKLITKRCLREIKVLQHFNGHPRIIDLKALDIVDPRNFNEVYLIQSCCDTTMADIIHSKLELEPVHYQWFMYQLFSGLKYIHSANVLHRDLKPGKYFVLSHVIIIHSFFLSKYLGK